MTTSDEANAQSVLLIRKSSESLPPSFKNFDCGSGIFKLERNSWLLIKIRRRQKQGLPPSGGVPKTFIYEVVNSEGIALMGLYI